jgi:hypothetical protein
MIWYADRAKNSRITPINGRLGTTNDLLIEMRSPLIPLRQESYESKIIVHRRATVLHGRLF